jgi:hypothetical protein
MTDEAQRSFDFREHLAEVIKGSDELASQNRLLEIECECAHRQNTILVQDVERLTGELDRVTGQLKKLQRENARFMRILTNAGNLISDGVQEVNAVRQGERRPLRGVPTRNDDSMPRVVRMGPARD